LAGVVVMEVLGGRESDDPESDDQGADGEDPFADGAVVMGKSGRFTDAEDLAAETDGHKDDSDGESEPGETHMAYLCTLAEIDAERGKCG
jgi:hypothetical protein